MPYCTRRSRPTLHRRSPSMAGIHFIVSTFRPITIKVELNERFYGGLTGMNKHDAVRQFGKETIKVWRRTFNIRPPEMDVGNPLHPVHDVKYFHVPQRKLPYTESLVDVIDRVKPIYEQEILPRNALNP